MKRASIVAAALTAIASIGLAGSASAAVNLLTNGSFETGDLTGWNAGGNTAFMGVTTSFSGVTAEDGAWEVFGGAIGSDLMLSQTFTDVAGQTYAASGWVYGFGGSPSDFGMQINGNTAAVYVSPYPQSGWTKYSFNFTGTGSDTLTVLNRNDPSYQLLDNFSVSGALPEPATWAMMIIGVGMIGFAVRRRVEIAAA